MTFRLTAPPSPEPRPAARIEDHRDPFRIEGPALVSFSGGRTSAYMLRRILDAHGGRLPADVHVVFQNTGKEFSETLDFVRDCEERWGVPIHWIEYQGRDLRAPVARARIDGVWRVPHIEVTHATASRKGEPFDRLITEKSFLPNGVMRFCTQDLKIRMGRDFMLALGYQHWTTAVGLRYDEPRRVHTLKARDEDEWDVACPLYDGRITHDDVMAFWRAAPFDLRLQRWESNCAGCFLKSVPVLERIERERPGTLRWWAEWEERMGATFQRHRPVAGVLKRASLPMLPGVADLSPDDDGSTIPCTCTE